MRLLRYAPLLAIPAVIYTQRSDIAKVKPLRDAMLVPTRAAIWATGRATGCPFDAAMGEIGAKLTDAVERLEQRSRRVEKRDGLELWRTPHGDFWTPPDNALLFDLAEQEIDIYGGEAVSVQAGDVVLDCGANVGTFTRTALKAGAAKVITFEIDPRNLAALKLTFASEISAGRVIVVEKGVWDEPGSFEAKFYSNTNLNSVAMESRTETREKPIVRQVPLVRIDDAMRELGIERVGFIKMDIEGAEPKALAGAVATIRRDKPRMSIATENQPGDIVSVPAFVEQLGLGYRAMPGPCRKIRAFTIRPEVVFFAAK